VSWARPATRFPGVRQPFRSGPDGDVVRRDRPAVLGPRGPRRHTPTWSARSVTCLPRLSRSPTPVGCTPWALGIPKGAKNPDGAWKFISWMTSKDYMKLVGEKLGWGAGCHPVAAPPPTTELPRIRGDFEVLRSVDVAVDHQRDPGQAHRSAGAVHRCAVRRDSRVPGSGDAVSQQISAAIAGQKSVDAAMEQAQLYAEVVGKSYQEK